MAGLKINAFGGELPRSNRKRLNANVAEIALDVDLGEGTLRPWRERLFVEQCDDDVRSMIRLPNCCWLCGPDCADYAIVQPSCDFVVRTGVRPYLEIATFEEACRDEWCRAGPPCPPVAPNASPVNPVTPAEITKAVSQRAYRVTFVNKYGQEGPGSAPSQSFDVIDGESVIIQVPDCPDDEYCVTSVRLYRLGTAFESGSETSNPQNTEWFFVAEIPCDQSVYTDSLRDIDLSSSGGQLAIFVHEDRLPPPEGIRNVVSLENGSLAAIWNDFIIQSEPYAPGSWPLKFYKKLWQDDKPIRICAVKDVVYVGTNGHPYTIQTAPDCNTDGRQPVFRHFEPMPLIAPRSMAGGSGVCYFASNDGLVAISGTQQRVVGEQLWSKRQWQALHPQLMIGAVYDGFYFGFTDIYGFRLKTAEPEHFDPANAALTRLSDRPHALYESGYGGLYMAIDDRIEQWNAGTNYRPYYWQCVKQEWGRRTALNASYVTLGEPGPVDVRFATEKGDFATSIVSDEIFRMPNWMATQEVSVAISGTGEVEEIATGTSYKEAFRAGATV